MDAEKWRKFRCNAPLFFSSRIAPIVPLHFIPVFFVVVFFARGPPQDFLYLDKSGISAIWKFGDISYNKKKQTKISHLTFKKMDNYQIWAKPWNKRHGAATQGEQKHRLEWYGGRWCTFLAKSSFTLWKSADCSNVANAVELGLHGQWLWQCKRAWRAAAQESKLRRHFRKWWSCVQVMVSRPIQTCTCLFYSITLYNNTLYILYT